MPTIEVDFETFKEITYRRASEKVTEGDVVRSALGLPPRTGAGEGLSQLPETWRSDGVDFVVGTKLRHLFRGGRLVTAEIVRDGILADGKVFKGLSPAGIHFAGYQLNGWRFWEVQKPDGRWILAAAMRK
jgi:hypothetical protein